MNDLFCTPQGAISTGLSGFMAPSGCPFIYIYQAGAQRTVGAVASELVMHSFSGARTASVLPHRLHPSRSSPIAPFADAVTVDTTGRVTATGDTPAPPTEPYAAPSVPHGIPAGGRGKALKPPLSDTSRSVVFSYPQNVK
jgi:hypothetical protein